MIQKVPLPNNYNVQIVPDTWDNNIKVHLVDPISDVQTTLAVFENGRWRSEYVRNLSRFFEIMKLYPAVRRAVKKSFGYIRDAHPYGSFFLTLNCFKRKLTVQLHNITK
jgi:hypothetical protein